MNLAERRVPVSEETRRIWRLASRFPLDKEAYYPEHGGVQEFDHHTGKRCFDYGCGGGPDTVSFLRRGNEVWYGDIVPENLQITTDRITARGFGTRAHAVFLQDSAPIPIESDSLDLVSAHGVLHHIETPAPVVEEFYRVLSPGGLCYIMLHSEMLWERLLPEVRRRVVSGAYKNMEAAFCSLTDYGAPYARAYTDAEGRQLLEDAGFAVETSRVWNKSDFRTFKARKRKRD